MSHDPSHVNRHRNPVDFDHYLEKLEGPGRAAWQHPDRLVEALGLEAGDVACDVGAGPGYLALRMARAVGPKGTIHAIDVEPRMIEALRRRAREAGVRNVRALLSRPGAMALPPRGCDLVLIVNTFHHFPDGVAYLRALAGRLAPGGRIVNVDFHRREMPVGPPVGHRVSRSDFLAMAGDAGLARARERRFLPYQYFLELVPVTSPAKRRGAAKAKAPGGAPSPPRGRRVPGARGRAARSSG